MKHIITAAIAAIAISSVCSAAPQPKVVVELNGIHNGLVLTETAGKGFTYTTLANPKVKNAKSFYYVTSADLPGKEWKEYSISFIPNVKGCTFGLRSQLSAPGYWVDYDAIKVTGGSLYNPSFELINVNKEAAGWRYYSLDCLRANKKDAADGKNYITANAHYVMRQGIVFNKPGEKVTVTFKARLGQPVKVPAEKFFSSMKK